VIHSSDVHSTAQQNTDTDTDTPSAVDYSASILVAKASDDDAKDSSSSPLKKTLLSKPHLATNIKTGMRMPSFKVLNQSDARPWHLQELLKSNGRWRILVFAGDLTSSSASNNFSRIEKLGQSLGGEGSFLRKYTPPGKPIDSVIEVLTVHSGPRYGLELLDLPEIFHPWSEGEGWDYWKVFVDDESYHEGHGKAYENYGIDAKTGAGVIVRPDGYVSWVGEMDDYETMEQFFAGFMREQGGSGSKTKDLNGGNGVSTMVM